MYYIIVTCTNTTEILSLEAAHTLSCMAMGGLKRMAIRHALAHFL